MVTELDIAGEFIYDGIYVLNQMATIDQSALLFSFLYHISVGLERLQKIVIVLFEDINLENYKKFEKSLITHCHMDLSKRICKCTGINMNACENEFLQMLTVFYKSERYHRFNLESQFSAEQDSVANFIAKYLPPKKIQRHFLTDGIIISNDVKELFGRVIGKLSKKYYNLVCEGCVKSRTFSYELRSGSKAQKIFLGEYQKKSLQQQRITEEIVLKELLVYLRNTKDSNELIELINSIPPLDIDPALLNDYIFEVSKGIVPQSLIDEVEFLYGENGYSIDRSNQIKLIGNPDVSFDWDTDFDDE